MTALERLQRRTGDTDTNLLQEMLDSASAIILARRFPYNDYPASLPGRYFDLQVRIAEDMYNRLGASGQLSHSENGISRTWGAEWVSNQLLEEITPLVSVV